MDRRSSKLRLLVGVALTSLGPAIPALAQSQEAATTLGDVIVTARRTQERLQDVPISITVYSEEQIANRNIVTATDLGTYTPSLSVNQRFGPEKSSFAIRGFVQEPSTAPSVGVYFADVVAPRAQGGTTSGNTAVVGSFMDLQNVQVLKGPQGTLFGRNTTGGAVLLVPNRPVDSLEGWVEGQAGDYNMWRAQGVLNVPVNDKLRFRLALDRNKRDGYMKNKSGIGTDNYNDVNYFAGRLSAIVDLTPDLETYTIGTYSNSFSRGYGTRIAVCNPNVTPASGGAIFTALPACDQIARAEARGDGPLDVDINNPDPYLKLRHWAVINTTTWRASDTLTIKNIVSYQEFRERASFSLNGDNFTSRFPAGLPASRFPNGVPFSYILLNPAGDGNNSAQSTFSEELQFQGRAADDRLTWQAGGYLEQSDPIGFSAGYTGILATCTNPSILACTNPFGSGQISASATKFWFRNKGVYAQATYELTDQLSLTGGIRYTWDKTRALAQSTRIAPQADGSFVETCNDVVRFFNGAPGVPLVVTDQAQCRFQPPAEKSKKPTWLIDVDYKPTDDVLLYAKYVRGYRAGGINMTSIGLEGWGPEKVDNYEVGVKTGFRHGAVRGSLNVAAFYNKLSNQQLNVSAPSSVAGFAGAQPTVNAGKSKIQGVEVDGVATFFDRLRFELGYTYLDTELISINVPPIPAGAPYSALIPTAVAGGPLALAPKNRVSLTGTYTLPLSDRVGEVSLAATFVHTDKQTITQATLPDFREVPATDLLNLNVNWNNVMSKPIDLAFFVTNVTNEKYPVSVGSTYNSAGFENLLYGAPRMWGVRLRYSFGG
ncbi:TonB-dependent receptor [Phenylobacterium sp. LjRoot225]|uniref:TonB-dependent receptor n=1 Tax=Phenylobacterium sp. LjRoot225 TaxID=3342285 RepID=UPI003ED05774